MIFLIFAMFIAAIAIFAFGYSKGKSAEKSKQLTTILDDVSQTKKRRTLRRADDIATVRSRMRKFTSKS